jgi:hypothetical protein
MDYLLVTVKTLGAIVLMTLLVPLMVWGGSGNWRRALEAWRDWWLIMGGLCVVVIGAAGVVMLVEYIG